MITCKKSKKAWDELAKALGDRPYSFRSGMLKPGTGSGGPMGGTSGPASPGSEISHSGKQRGGPTSAPKPGHKYIKRWWAGDHWEYEWPEDQQPSAPQGGGAEEDEGGQELKAPMPDEQGQDWLDRLMLDDDEQAESPQQEDDSWTDNLDLDGDDEEPAQEEEFQDQGGIESLFSEDQEEAPQEQERFSEEPDPSQEEFSQEEKPETDEAPQESMAAEQAESPGEAPQKVEQPQESLSQPEPEPLAEPQVEQEQPSAEPEPSQEQFSAEPQVEQEQEGPQKEEAKPEPSGDLASDVGKTFTEEHPYLPGENIQFKVTQKKDGTPEIEMQWTGFKERGKGAQEGGFSTKKKKFKSWEGVNELKQRLAHTKVFTDESGNPAYAIYPRGGKNIVYDEGRRAFVDQRNPNEKKVYTIKAFPGSRAHQHLQKQSRSSLYAPTPAAALQSALGMHSAEKRIKEAQQKGGFQSASDQLAQGKSARDILVSGSLPTDFNIREGFGARKDRVANIISEQEKDQLIYGLLNDQETVSLLSKIEQGDNQIQFDFTSPEDVVQNKDSLLYKTLSSVVRGFDPNYYKDEDKNKAFNKYLKQKLSSRAAFQGKGQVSLEGRKEGKEGEGRAFGEQVDLSSQIERNKEQMGGDFDAAQDAAILAQEHGLGAAGGASEPAEDPKGGRDVGEAEVQQQAQRMEAEEEVGTKRAELLQDEHNRKLNQAMEKFGLNEDHPIVSYLDNLGQQAVSKLQSGGESVSPDKLLEKMRNEALREMGGDQAKEIVDAFLLSSDEFNEALRGLANKSIEILWGEYQLFKSLIMVSLEEDIQKAQQMEMQLPPDHFTPDGRQLTRAPYPGAPVQWNPNYHSRDPKNLWACRWVNPVTGQHEYAYIEDDMQAQPKLQTHRVVSEVDTRLPYFRNYVASLFRSPHQKDQVVATMLALMDQGRFRILELTRAKVGNLEIKRDLIRIGKRFVHCDPRIRQELASMANGRFPNEPLFAVPVADAEGGLDPSNMRKIGANLINSIIKELGLTPEALQMYHASQTYSSEVQRIIMEHNVSTQCAERFAMLEVAHDLGHDLDTIEDFEPAIDTIKDSVVDPIVVEAIEQNCQKLGLGMGPDTLRKPVFPSIPRVISNLRGRTEDEEEFSKWLRIAPIHEFAEEIDGVTGSSAAA